MPIGKIIGNVSKQTVKSAVTSLSDVQALQKINAEALSKSLASLENFTKQDLPQIVSKEKKIAGELERLAQLAKSSLK